MHIRRFANGDLLVPDSREGPNGTLVDGRRIARKGEPDHDDWEKWLADHDAEARPLSPEEEPLARAEAKSWDNSWGPRDPENH